jgi:hypothetical protein
VNFGRVPGEKGVWSVPYITNMAMRVVGSDGQLVPEIQQAQAAARAGAPVLVAAGALRWRRRWSRRIEVRAVDAVDAMVGGVYDYNSKNESKYDPRATASRPAATHDGHAVSDGDHPAAGTQAHHHDLRRCDARLARDLHGRPQVPEGDELNPTYLGYSVGRWENPDTLVVENKGFNENSWLDTSDIRTPTR